MTPSQVNFKMPAEWHPHERCWMAWPCHEPSWEKIGLPRAQAVYAEIAQAIALYEPVTMIARPEDLALAQELCGNTIQCIPMDINDSWTRDTGPSFLLNEEGKLAGVDWNHNAWGNNYSDYTLDQKIAAQIINLTDAEYFHANLVMEGGAFHVDGQGTILTTKECLLHKNRNPQLTQKEIEHYLCDYLGGSKVIWLNQGLIGDETDGHIDEIATFIGEAKVLCLISSDKHDPNYDRLQENLAILQAATDACGRRLEVFTVEQPPATELGGDRLTLSYVNFYRANGGIVLPSFGYESYDKAAYQVFQQIAPSYKLSQVPALDLFTGGGGIHCITQQQPRVIAGL